MADLPFDPFALLNKSQKVALGVAGDAFDALIGLGKTAGKTALSPDEAIRQVSSLVNAVGDLASASVQPLQDFITKQREIADTMASLAAVQADLAGLVESLAQRHAAIVGSLENLTAPIFGLVNRDDS
jgi:phage-related protein